MLKPMPLSGHNVLHTRDVDVARVEVGRIFCPHRLLPATGGPGDDIVFNHAPMRHVSVNWVDYGRDVRIEPVPFESFYLLQVVRDGQALIENGRERFEIKQGRASLINPTDHVAMNWEQGCRKLILRIDRAGLERFAESWFDTYLGKPLIFNNGLAWSAAQSRSLRALVNLIVNDFECDMGVLSTREAQRHFEDSLFTALLVSQPHNHSHLNHDRSPAVPRAVKRVEAYIEAHAGDDITIADLVEVGGVSTRTLFESFRKFRGLTPMQMLRRHRLEQVRSALLKPGQSLSVTELAMQWNFEQLGRFAQYYRSVYGELPSDTLRRGR